MMVCGGGSAVRVEAPAKVNLFLQVLAREAGGYHQIETVFQALDFSDTLEVSRRPGPGVALAVEGILLGPPDENLVYRAADAFLTRGRVGEGVEILLTKRIPVQAGLGGGSSDAAAALKALAFLFPDALTPPEVLALAGELGSDVAFFLGASPTALGWGRGQRLLALPPLPSSPVLVAVPPVGVSTAWAYEALSRHRESEPPTRLAASYRLEDLGSWETIASLACNDFQEVVFDAFPRLAFLSGALAATGPRLALLAGSGGALFAVYGKEEEAHQAKETVGNTFPEVRWFVTRSRARMPGPELAEPPDRWRRRGGTPAKEMP